MNLDEYLADFDRIPSVTFAQLAAGYAGAGWAFTVDDWEIDTWFSWRETLAAHHVHATFFVAKYATFTPEQKAKLKQLADDGHDIEVHGVNHVNATETVASIGFDRWYADEVAPSRAALEADGYKPVAFAYPYGAHTREIDRQLSSKFALIRTTGAANCF